MLPLEAEYMPKNEEDMERYSRQIRFSPIGITGQQMLGEASILIVGSGALGASLAQHMVRAGVGSLRLVDRDYVEWSNLQRQMLFDEEDARLALPKSVAAVNKLRRINSRVRVEALVADVNIHNVDSLLMGIDLVLDGTDNLETRMLLSDACFTYGIPLLYGGVTGSAGMSALLVPGDNCCLRCLIGEPGVNNEAGSAETCDTLGVISPAVEMIAALQATEAIKLLTGNREDLRRTWVVADIWKFSVKEWALPPVCEDCPFCGWGETKNTSRNSDQLDLAAKNTKPLFVSETAISYSGMEEETALVILCGRDTMQVNLNCTFHLTEWRRRLEANGCEITASNAYLLRAAIPSGERVVLFPDGRALLQGVEDRSRALEICRLYLNQMINNPEGRGHLIAENSGF